MKTIKTYEGFFDFLNKKEKKEVTLDDIRECLYDLADESRIKNQLNGVRLDGIFASNVLKKDLFSFTDDLVNKPSYIEKNFMITGNVITFNFIYNPNEISDKEVNELLLDCKSKLEIYDCETSFFIGWGRDEGSSSDKEWRDFKKMLDKTIGDNNRTRNITVKIESPNEFY
jgi:hypothetical protein